MIPDQKFQDKKLYPKYKHRSYAVLIQVANSLLFLFLYIFSNPDFAILFYKTSRPWITPSPVWISTTYVCCDPYFCSNIFILSSMFSLSRYYFTFVPPPHCISHLYLGVLIMQKSALFSNKAVKTGVILWWIGEGDFWSIEREIDRMIDPYR